MKTWSALKHLPLAVPSLQSFEQATLERMLAAGREVQECYRVLSKGDVNIVSEILKGQGTFFEDDHFPAGDVFDSDSASQYYYHAHRGIPGEHGHFHTFLRADGMPDDVVPVAYDGDEPWPEGDDRIAHLGAVSMDRSGFPLGFFMTNRWVTGENWYAADDVTRLIYQFDIDHAFPSWPANRWLSALLQLFIPHLQGLLVQRDAVVEAWAGDHQDRDVYEDRTLEITGWTRISVDDQIAQLEALLA